MPWVGEPQMNPPGGRVRVRGKQFELGGEPFHFRGITYGTFAPRADGARYPEREQLKRDFAAMRASGFTVVRTYTPPPDDVLDLAADWGLRLLSGVHYRDWRYLIGGSRSECRAIQRDAVRCVRDHAQRLAHREEILGLCLGNEVPADVLRWLGTPAVGRVLEELADVVRDVDPELLVTYANYPTAEYLALAVNNMDFVTFNVFLEDATDFRSYLTRLHHLAGDQPLVLGEFGSDAGTTPQSERSQADRLDAQLEIVLDRGLAGSCIFSWTDDWCVGEHVIRDWHFGLVRSDRSPRPALEVAERWNSRTVRDLDSPWPTISIVICAYNAESTLDECLTQTARLDYPGLEIIVVDDGSTDSTAAIARRYPNVILLSIPHAGLSVARNEGFQAARGDLIAYLDSDAYPSQEWPYYLALGMDGRKVVGVGGPNLVPPSDGLRAQQVARAPGGPSHVLLSDSRAEHVPGCNMAFWKSTLIELGGFDPIFTAAGDDVDICWRLLDRGSEIAFHPAAVVWHHRRASSRAYLRQQHGYGRSEALVEARHPNRFNSVGTACWQGHIYGGSNPSVRQRIYRGAYGTAAYQSVYRTPIHGLDAAHQAGLPLALCLLFTAPLALLWWPLGIGAAIAACGVLTLGLTDAVRAQVPVACERRASFRTIVTLLTLAQPVARLAGRLRARAAAGGGIARRSTTKPGFLPTAQRGVYITEHDRDRAEVVVIAMTALREAGLRIMPARGWEDHDGRVIGSLLISGDLVSSAHPPGWVQFRMRRRLRWKIAFPYVLLAVTLGVLQPIAGLVLCVGGALELVRGIWRTGATVERTLCGATT